MTDRDRSSDVAQVEAAPAPRVGRNITALASGQLVTWTMTLAWTIVVPRALGPAGMGVLVTAWSVTGVFGVILGLGTRNYLVRELVVDPDCASRLVGTAIVLRVLLAPLFLCSVAVFGLVANYGRAETLVLDLAAVAMVLTLVGEPMQAAFQAIERMEYLAYSDVINKSAQGLVGIVLALLGFRTLGITASWIVVAAIVIVLNAVWLRRHVAIVLRTTRRRIADMVRNSFAYWAFGVFFLVYLWIDSIMLSLMTRPEVVGWYGVPTRLFQTLMFLPMVVSTAWLPRLVRAFQAGPGELHRSARAPLELVLVLSLPICAATAILARPMIHLLYGSAYAEAAPVLIILGLCVPPMYLNIMLNQVLVAAKRQMSWTWVMAGATVINPLFNLALIPATEERFHNGAIGAAISLLLTEVVIVAVGIVIVGRTVFDRAVIRRTLLTGVASAAMWGVAYAMRPLGLVPALLAAGVTFVLLAALLRLVTPSELAWLRACFRRVLRRSSVSPASADAPSSA